MGGINENEGDNRNHATRVLGVAGSIGDKPFTLSELSSILRSEKKLPKEGCVFPWVNNRTSRGLPCITLIMVGDGKILERSDVDGIVIAKAFS